jgi:hypothetical protein
VRETCGVAGNDADACPALPAGTDVLDPAVVEPQGQATAVLGEDLGELAPRLEGLVQDASHDGFVD